MFCHECFKQLPLNDLTYCFACYKKTEYGEFCKKCSKSFILSGVWVASSYDQPLITKLIKTYKYHFAHKLSQPLSNFLCFFLRNLLNSYLANSDGEFLNLDSEKDTNKENFPKTVFDFSNTLLIPIPLHIKRLNWRGFNQSELIADKIANYFGIAINSKGLIRRKHKKAQALLKTNIRIKNLKNNFLWTGSSLVNQNIILIDDVATTCSTLNECARALKEAGANEIWGLVIAKG